MTPSRTGVLLDLIFDLVEDDSETQDAKVQKIVDACEGNDRLGNAFSVFLTWFKLEDTDAS